MNGVNGDGDGYDASAAAVADDDYDGAVAALTSLSAGTAVTHVSSLALFNDLDNVAFPKSLLIHGDSRGGETGVVIKQCKRSPFVTKATASELRKTQLPFPGI